jgi:hypothetical protein
LPVRRACQTQGYPPAHLSRLFDLSPIDALINLVFRCRLCRQIPLRIDLHPVIHLRITVTPQGQPACRGDA